MATNQHNGERPQTRPRPDNGSPNRRVKRQQTFDTIGALILIAAICLLVLALLWR